jgi:hypothetical protein
VRAARRWTGGLHGAVAVVLDGLDLNLSAAHGGDGRRSGVKAHVVVDAIRASTAR